MHFCMTQGPQGVHRTQIEPNVMRSPPTHGPTLRHLHIVRMPTKLKCSECNKNKFRLNAVSNNSTELPRSQKFNPTFSGLIYDQ